jgi:hypothetical protein
MGILTGRVDRRRTEMYEQHNLCPKKGAEKVTKFHSSKFDAYLFVPDSTKPKSYQTLMSSGAKQA